MDIKTITITKDGMEVHLPLCQDVIRARVAAIASKEIDRLFENLFKNLFPIPDLDGWQAASLRPRIPSGEHEVTINGA